MLPSSRAICVESNQCLRPKFFNRIQGWHINFSNLHERIGNEAQVLSNFKITISGNFRPCSLAASSLHSLSLYKSDGT
uniref:Uncharacterized protein n=1 Tax=Daucus carota subsp. sativus TaxID=79200 RepID=A0A166FTS2_DAUCS